MENQKQQVATTLTGANNVLVTVSTNPSVDQLAACIGLTLALNKLGKHATAVFSGEVPSTIEFLQPEKTLEKNTDSLRDFIISLDKSKADKLRYKVEDTVVKIFITPYKTSISDKDLEFSQGDFNVDAVVAIGVHDQTQFDQAIIAHGRILHDASVISINTQPGGEPGGIIWLDTLSSSLSELVSQLVEVLGKQLLDNQIATALLTGIVAETDRFSNDKTSPRTMSVAAELMAAGANQQLVATKLDAAEMSHSTPVLPKVVEEIDDTEAPVKKSDGTLEIAHEASIEPEAAPEPEPVKEAPQIHIDEHGEFKTVGDTEPEAAFGPYLDEPLVKPDHRPRLGAAPSEMPLSAATGGNPANLDDSHLVDPLSVPEADTPILERTPLQPSQPSLPVVSPTAAQGHEQEASPQPSPTELPEESVAAQELSLPEVPSEPLIAAAQPAPVLNLPELEQFSATPNETLAEIEHEVQSPHVSQLQPAPVAETPVNPFASGGLQLPDPASIPTQPLSDFSLPAEPQIPVVAPQDNIPQSPTLLSPFDPSAAPSPATPVPSVAVDASANLNDARSAVEQAINSIPAADQPQAPIQALNAQPLGIIEQPQVDVPAMAAAPAPAEQQNPNSPPPVPPPMLPPTYPS